MCQAVKLQPYQAGAERKSSRRFGSSQLRARPKQRDEADLMNRRIWKAAAPAFVIAAALTAPAPGPAATLPAWKGVIVGKDPARTAVITASAGGVVRTLRGAAAARMLAIGQAIRVRAQRLRDGTFRAQRVTLAGRAATAQLRGVLVQYRAGRYLVSAGGSVLAVRGPTVRKTAAASVAGARPGDKVVMKVSLTRGTLTATSVQTVGHTGSVELEGIFLGPTGGQLRLAVAHRGEVLITVPAGLTLPLLSPGDELELVVTVGTTGTFTLVRLGESEEATTNDESADDNDQGEDNNDQGEDNDDQGDDGD
jgi:hypothetical protein